MQSAIPTPTPTRFEIVFDGGSLGNPGKGYGTYEITANGQVVRHQRHDYGDWVTNNEAEYQTLIEALSWLAGALGKESSSTSVLVNGDSQLVLNQLLGRWRVKTETLLPFHQRARSLINEFATVDLVWHGRANSVKRLGH